MVLAVELQLSVEKLDGHRAVGLDVDLELGSPHRSNRGLAGDLEGRSRDQFLDVRERAADLLGDLDVLHVPGLGEMGRVERQLGLACQPGQSSIGKLDRRPPLGVGFHLVAGLHLFPGRGWCIRAAASSDRRHRLVNRQRGGDVDRRLGREIEPVNPPAATTINSTSAMSRRRPPLLRGGVRAATAGMLPAKDSSGTA